ncbi:Lysine histidine transporter-like 7 [Raphanus sativus]|uniref:Lysine histidine transporter-like 7 n=1 Tax=Raphanus sativus TaxID=3726 RepID=A0A6J0MC35_RAPSA|nr:lysine histidine transporter-like 7 [Raphanus sativus]KAJ4913943.1 Lysine histidine transporter-like 7 [Raphanus sativus]
MSKKALGLLLDLESQESCGPPSFMSHTLSKDTQPTSDDDDRGDVGRIPVEEWLPITESRKGNVFTATFHLFCSGLGFQVLLLPAAFAALGWVWGIIILTVGFAWKLYTTWLLVHLHEAVHGTRFSRYLRLAIASFGIKLGKLLGIFPVMYLSGGACSILVITGGKTIKQLLHIMYEGETVPLTTLQCFVIFSCLAVVMSQFPNLNSLFGLSFIGGVMAIAYSTAIWSLPLTRDPQRDHQNNVSYAIKDTSFDNIFNAIGLIAISLRGNNLILEIQGTLPSDSKNPSSKTMWRAVVISHVIIAVCMFLVAIVVYWAYGDKIPATGGPIGNYLKLYEQDYSKRAACFIHITFIINCLCSYPINLMPACDNAEMVYVTKRRKPCSVFVRMMFRVFLGLVCFFIAVGFSFLPYLAVLIGAVALLVTFTYPCFMWISIKQPERKSLMWLLNILVGSLGASLSVLLVVASALFLADRGLHANFFKP